VPPKLAASKAETVLLNTAESKTDKEPPKFTSFNTERVVLR